MNRAYSKSCFSHCPSPLGDTAQSGGGFLPLEGGDNFMNYVTFTELFQFVIMMTGVVTLVVKLLRDNDNKKK